MVCITNKILSYNELKNRIIQISKLKGEFVLRSGEKTNYYFDKYKFESDPYLLFQIGWHLTYQFNFNCDALAGLEIGGIPLAIIVGQIIEKPVVFVRKQAKTYGTCKIAEGININNQKICVIEDVITTGGQVCMSVNNLRSEGAIIDSVYCVILRSQEGRKNIENNGLILNTLFDLTDEIGG